MYVIIMWYTLVHMVSTYGVVVVFGFLQTFWNGHPVQLKTFVWKSSPSGVTSSPQVWVLLQTGMHSSFFMQQVRFLLNAYEFQGESEWGWCIQSIARGCQNRRPTTVAALQRSVNCTTRSATMFGPFQRSFVTVFVYLEKRLQNHIFGMLGHIV